MRSPFLTSRLVDDSSPYDYDNPDFVPVMVREYAVTVGDDTYNAGRNFADARALLVRLTEHTLAGREVWPCTWTVERTDGYECDFPSDRYVD